MFRNLNLIKTAVLLYSLTFVIQKDARAQKYIKDYTPISSTGTLPGEFIKTAREMSEADIKGISYSTDRTAKVQFAMANNYFIKDLLLSGNVLVNDPLTIYVNKVADELLKNDTLLRSQLHIYVTKSSDVNAYAFDKGFIFINIGLLAQLENEAQLAFVLGHEITHVVKKHSVNQYIEEIKLEKGTSTYERGSYDERSLAKYRFSKEQESEADVEGLNLVKKTNYSIKALNGAFDVLQYSYLPFELLDFKKSFFENENLVLPDTFYLKKTSEVKANDDYDDTKSTHPNIRKRRGTIEPSLKVADESNRKKYIVSEEEFKTARETARFETCKLYMAERDYVNAIYAGYILLQKYPDNLYLKKIVSTALYNISVNKSRDNRRSYISIGDEDELSSKTYTIEDYQKIEGASQRVYYMLDNLSAKELNVVALSYTYKAHKQYPSDSLLSGLTDSLLSELVNSNSLYLNDFSRESKAELRGLDTIKKVVKDTIDPEESKYAKIKRLQQKVEVETEDNFVKYALVDFLKDNDFVERYTKMSNGLLQQQATVGHQNNLKKAKKKSGDKLLGIEKVIFIDPFYRRVNYTRDGEEVNFYESEDQQQVLTDIQKSCADRLHLAYVSMTTKGMTVNDMDRYNDNALVNDWLGERFKHGDNNNEIVSSSEAIKRLIQKDGTKYIAWSGVYNSKGRSHNNTYFFIVFNIESGTMMKFETRHTQGRDNKDMITSFVYNSLMHVVKKEKQ